MFYSASCGGQSETASEVWPGADSRTCDRVEDDVHADDVPWTLELTLDRFGRRWWRQDSEAIADGIEIEARNDSGRVAGPPGRSEAGMHRRRCLPHGHWAGHRSQYGLLVRQRRRRCGSPAAATATASACA